MMAAHSPDPREDVPSPAGAATRDAVEPRVASEGCSSQGGHNPQPRNPLHGVTLEAMLVALVDHYGWDGLGERVPVRCFNLDPSVSSSLRFLRKTPWARAKVEGLYLATQRAQQRKSRQR